MKMQKVKFEKEIFSMNGTTYKKGDVVELTPGVAEILLNKQVVSLVKEDAKTVTKTKNKE